MKRLLILALGILAGILIAPALWSDNVAQAGATAAWGRGIPAIAHFIDQNSERAATDLAINLSQNKLDILEALWFPAPTPAERLEVVKRAHEVVADKLPPADAVVVVLKEAVIQAEQVIPPGSCDQIAK